MDDVQPLREGTDNGISDGMVAADHHGEAPARQDLLRHLGRAREAALDVGGRDVGIAAILDQIVPHLKIEIGLLSLWVIEAALSINEAERMLSNRARAPARSRVERRAFVERHAQNSDGAVKLVNIAADAGAQEGRNA